MSPLVSRFLFVVACLTVPIVWGIVVNWVFHRLKTASPPAEEEADAESSDEPVIEYYI